MYQVNHHPFGDYTRLEVFNQTTANRFSIIPAKGANVLSIYFNDVNILDGYKTPVELEMAKWGKSALLFPFPNRLDRGRYSWEGKEYQFPINNAATENAIHGFVRDEAFEITKIELAPDYGSVHCRYQYPGDRTYYPFPFTLDLVFTIRDNHSFSVKTSCTNQHDKPIPFGFGWHPYFRLTEKADDHSLSLPDCTRVEINERMIPTGVRTDYSDFAATKAVNETFLDNCFAATETGKYKLAVHEGKHTISVEADSVKFPFFQVFTPPHRMSIALEPMTCNVDAFNNCDGLTILHPGEKWSGTILIKYQ
jgi:aldose 1-epimerase